MELAEILADIHALEEELLDYRNQVQCIQRNTPSLAGLVRVAMRLEE